MTETHIGLIVTAIPALLIGGILLGRYRLVLWMYIAALVVGLGYLTTTGAIDEIGRKTIGYIPNAHLTPAAAPAAAPEAAPAPAAEPAPAPAPEAAAPAPAPEAAPAPAPEAAPAPAPEAAPAAPAPAPAP